MSEPTGKSPLLEYATPQKRSVWSVVADVLGAVLGTAMALFGAAMLAWGVPGIVWLVRDWGRADAGDVTGIVIVNLIGLICGFMSVRWIGDAVRRRSVKRKQPPLRATPAGAKRSPEPSDPSTGGAE